MEDSVRGRLWAACRLAGAIDPLGNLKTDSRTAAFYREAGFHGRVYSFAGGPQGIDAGLVCASDIGLVIALRGTTPVLEDWKNNFQGELVPYPGGGRVHSGFLSSVRHVQGPLTKKALELLPAQKPEKLYLTGHSKGGAMAALLAALLSSMTSPLFPAPAVVTFGAPRTGDQEYAESYPCPLTRLESCRDIVPHLPLTPQEAACLRLLLAPGGGWLEPFLLGDLCLYAPLGRLVNICPPQVDIPCDVRNKEGENLNALYYILTRLILKGQFSLIAEYHTSDYPGTGPL